MFLGRPFQYQVLIMPILADWECGFAPKPEAYQTVANDEQGLDTPEHDTGITATRAQFITQ